MNLPNNKNKIAIICSVIIYAIIDHINSKKIKTNPSDI